MTVLTRLLFCLSACLLAGRLVAAESIFDRSNLAAWCIVPFDAKKRGPEERAAMLERMGVRKFVYDYRKEHIPQWEEELAALGRHGIELLGWWFPTTLNDDAKAALALFQRHGVKPQLWVMGNGGPIAVADAADQSARVEREVARLTPIARAAAEAGCRVALYNHGAWFGEPENMVAIVEALNARGVANVGIVYNLHHGHGHLARLESVLPRMLPHLLCFNLNGMDVGGDAVGRKILPLGAGAEDVRVLRILRVSGYRGPVGILNHTDADAEGRLLDNLDGLAWLLPQLDGAAPGAKPRHRTWSERAPAPAEFSPERRPLRPEDARHWQAPVNRERVFDFYAKQARAFMGRCPPPALLPAYPGLDGGQQGHWGNQNDAVTWKDGRWAAADHGTVFSGAFKGGGLTIAKAVCVRFDDRAACFDPATLSFPIVWRGGFIRLSDARHGFMSPAQMDGAVVEKRSAKNAGVYLGFYRHGKETIFSYTRDGGRRLVNARGDDATALEPLTRGGPAQWPQWIETRGALGAERPFATDTLTIPWANPHGTLFFLSGHDFLPDGTAAVATMTGEVWLVRGIDERLERLRWKRFATGLYQPLGVKVIGDRVHLLGRDQITRLHDLNGDDEADFYECVTNAMATSTGGHDYSTGLEADAQGRWYFASQAQGVVRLAGREPPVALGTGFRNPNGLGLSPDGRFLTTSVQEGDWTPASAICQIEIGVNEGAHFGAGGPLHGRREPPLLHMPRGEDNSSGGQHFLPADAWPALRGEGNLLHLSPGTGSAWLVMRQQVGARWQAAAWRVSGHFDSGAQAGRFHPRDGHFYVTGMQGWGSYTPLDGCFQRVRFTGGVPAAVACEARENGVLLRFDSALDATLAGDAASHFAQCWDYRYGPAYGSPEYSLRYPDTPGHDPIAIRSAQVLDGGRTLFLELPQLTPAGQIHLHVRVTPDRAHDLFLTAHALGAAFTSFPGYTAIPKAPAPDPHAAHRPAPARVAFDPVEWEHGEPGRELRLKTATGLQFSEKELRAKAGERLTLRFENPDAMPHNWVLIRADATERVGELADRMIAAPDAMKRHYVPESPDVLAHTRVLDPQTQTAIHFTAPTHPGRYPYLCTFPGHWMIMRGALIVE